MSRNERDESPTDAPADGPQAEGEAPVRRAGKIPASLLDADAVTVVRRLNRFGHEAYLVGGCVRDLLSGLEPKDFDVATDALPNRIKRVFRNARIIGRRFRLAHIRFGPDHVIETATFRADPPPDAPPPPPPPEHGGRRAPRMEENVFGTAPEDARRRDFTINALFYDPVTDEILDWVGGLADLDAGIVRSIGEPVRRIHEDPVRMIRAVHFAERMGFEIEGELEAAIASCAGTLAAASPARLYIELLKVLTRAKARPTLHRLHEMGVLRHWVPELDEALGTEAVWPATSGGTHADASHGEPDDLPVPHETWNLLGAADHWGMTAHGADDALALAPLLGPWILDRWRAAGARRTWAGFAEAFEDTLRPMAVRMSMPRRTLARLRDLLFLSLELQQPPDGRRTRRVVHRPAFPLAMAYLRLSLEARDRDLELLEAWAAVAPPPSARPPTQEREPRSDRPRRRRGSRRGRHRRTERDPQQRRGVRAEASAWTPAPPSDEETRERGPAPDGAAPREHAPDTAGDGTRRRRRRRRRRPPTSGDGQGGAAADRGA